MVAALASCGWLSVASAEEHGEPEQHPVREYASRTVMIIGSIEGLEEKVQQVLEDPNLMLEAFGPEEEGNWWPGVHVEPIEPPGPQGALLRIIVPLRFGDYDDEVDEHGDDDEHWDGDDDDEHGDGDDDEMLIDPGKAEHLLDLVTGRIRQRLAQAHRFRAESMSAELAHVGGAFERAQSDLEKLFAKRRGLLAESAGIGVGSDELLERIGRLDEQRYELELASSGAAAHRKATEQRVAEARAQVGRQVAEDPMAGELARIVELRERHVGEVRKGAEAGRASGRELNDAEIALAEASARLLERREHVHRQAGGEFIGELTASLFNLAAESADAEARFVLIDRRIERTRAMLDKADEFDLVRRSLPEAKEVYADTLRAKRELERVVETLREPKVEVLDD